MAEIERVLINLTNRELNNASNCATRSTIKMRVLLKIADMLGLSLQSIYETKSLIRVDVSVSNFIEKLWMLYYSSSRGGRNTFAMNMKPSSNTFYTTTTTNANTSSSSSSGGGNSSSSSNNNNFNSFPTSDEWATLERFLAKDFARNVDLIRLTAVLKKRLPEKDLNFVFAVDGLLHSVDTNTSVAVNETSENSHNNNVNDYKNYFENLSVPLDRVVVAGKKTKNDEEEMVVDGDDDEEVEEDNHQEPIGWFHVNAIRAIYKRVNNATPEKIGNVLKKIYRTIENGDSAISSKTIQSEEDSTSSSSSDSESSENDERDTDNNEIEKCNDTVEDDIEKIYKKIVGDKLANIALWKKMEMERVVSKESSRKRKHDSNENDGGERRNKPGRPPRKNKLSLNDVVVGVDEKKNDDDEEEENNQEKKANEETEILNEVNEMKNDEMNAKDQVHEKKNISVVIVKKKKANDKSSEYTVAKKKKLNEK